MPMMNDLLTGRVTPVHIVGLAATQFLPEHDAMLDELVFEVVHAALRECGLRRPDSGLSVLASMDVLDGRSISCGLTTAAAGGYLRDSYRLEGDSGLAIIAAAEAVAAGDVDVAIAAAVHNPEISPRRELMDDALAARHAFLRQISNLGFEPHTDRPIGLTADSVYAMHAAHCVGDGTIDVEQLAQLAADEITRGAKFDRAVRNWTATADDVLASRAVSWPLHQLMLPAHSGGAVAAVLASPARAGRCIGRSARITGFGHATGQYTWTGQWLTDPGEPTRRAAMTAYTQSGVSAPAEQIELVEVSAPTPALHTPYLAALGLGPLCAGRVNASGGMRSNYPGLANGVLRLLEVVEGLESKPGVRAVSHSVDTITGLVSEDVTVIVVEAV
jgi:acetyl-CoA acetyltransferase